MLICVVCRLNACSWLFLLFSQSLMLTSSTTRPLLGCVWKFPSNYSGLSYATASMAIHEVLPIILMVVTNVTSLYTLYTHGKMRSSMQDAAVVKRVPAERRAAKVTASLKRQKQTEVMLNFFFCDPPPPGDSGSSHDLRCVLGNQHHLCQLFQLQQRLLSRLPPGHRSLCQHLLHRLVTCCSVFRTQGSAYLHQIYTHLRVMVHPADDQNKPNYKPLSSNLKDY